MFDDNNPTIEFRDRPLRKGEKYHHKCKDCGQELHPDLAYSHRCSLIINKNK